MSSLLRRILKQRRGFPDIVSVNSESLLALRRDSFVGLPAPKYLVETRCSREICYTLQRCCHHGLCGDRLRMWVTTSPSPEPS